jgi:hypothetical protein
MLSRVLNRLDIALEKKSLRHVTTMLLAIANKLQGRNWKSLAFMMLDVLTIITKSCSVIGYVSHNDRERNIIAVAKQICGAHYSSVQQLYDSATEAELDHVSATQPAKLYDLVFYFCHYYTHIGRYAN